MKNSKFFQYCILQLIVVFLLSGCQDLERPVLGDNFPLDGPIITLINPSPSGTTTIKSVNPITSITIKFKVEDDIQVANVVVKFDDAEIANMSDFSDIKMVNVDDLTYDEVSTGNHTVTIIATDSDGNVVTENTTFAKEDTPPYDPQFNGEIFYMPFDGSYADLVSNNDATAVGTPGFAGESKVGSDSYTGAPDSYLTFPTEGLLGSEFSASFWYKVNATPDRAGILVVGDNADDRFQGFRLFREGDAANQTIKLNVGTGTGESWNNGGALDATAGEWVHVAFTISETETKIYFNGVEVNTGTLSSPVDWTGCSEIVIGSGGPTFEYWGHLYDSSDIDELRIFNVALTQQDIMKQVAMGYQKLYMPFEGSFTNKVSDVDATVVGNPGFAGQGYESSNAYTGSTDAYLTVPTEELNLGNEFSATLWYKINAVPNRAGILTISPPDTGNANYPDTQNLRTNGFRFFREGGATNQTFKLNVGNGTADSWFDGGALATIDPTANDGWVHLAFTISNTECVVYINGEVVKQDVFSGVDWTGCDLLSIGSGAPRFTEWGHLSDSSYMDELHLYNKALTQEEIQAIMAQ